jgi:aryl carrier-like protein
VSEKPRHRSGYGQDELEQVKAACLTVAVTLGAYLDDVCIVGGLVPTLLIDARRHDADDEDIHPGTNDLDIGLALALLDEQRYAEIADRLRAEGFEADTNEADRPTLQRWRMGAPKVTIDFLMEPSSPQDRPGSVQPLQPDFGVLITPGVELAFDGHTLNGERVSREVPVCGPAAFVVLKALAFADRAEPKDAYDLVYVIRHTAGRGDAIAQGLARHAERHADIVQSALALLARDFDAPDGLGPGRAADFMLADEQDRDADAADAHGFVDDLLRATRREGVSFGSIDADSP